MSHRMRRRAPAFLGAAVAALLALGGVVTAPLTANADSGVAQGTVSSATLDWGVKQTFRNYIKGFAKGTITLLGNTSDEVKWTGGTGVSAVDGSSADVNFGAGNGVWFQGHEMTVNGQTANALDMRFTNPRVKVTSSTTGVLYLDVKSRKFESVSTISQEFFEQANVPFANLTLSAPATSGSTLTWTAAPAVLTTEGALAFGSFYKAGDPLDPVTFSLPVTPAAATTTTVQAPSATVFAGSKTPLSATVSPAAAGSVTFFNGGTKLGDAVPVTNGSATLAAAVLANGNNSVTATFTPDNPAAYQASTSSAVNIMTKSAKLEVFLADGTTPAGNTQLAAGDKIVVKGSGYDPAANVGGRGMPIPNTLPQGVYVVFGEFSADWRPSEGKQTAVRAGGPQGWVLTEDTVNKIPAQFQNAVKAQWIKVDANGDFTWTATLANPAVAVPSGGTFGVYTYGAGGVTNAAQELSVPLNYETKTSTSTLATPASQIGFGAELTLTTTVSPAVAGTVQYYYGASERAITTALGSPVAVSNGVAKLTTTELPLGSHFVRAKFTPSDSRAVSPSETKSAQVQVTATPTTTTLSAPQQAVDFGSEVELSAVVTPAGTTGSVTFYNGGTQIGSPSPLLAGRAVLKTTALPSGANKITARFTPANSAEYAESVSAEQVVTVSAQATTTRIEASASQAQFGTDVKLTATVSPSASGWVSFINGGTRLGEAVAVSNGKAVMTVSSLPAGVNTLTAVFTSGDSNAFRNSASQDLSVEITPRETTTTLTFPAASLVVGGDVTLTAKVSPAAAGTVKFVSSGGQSVGQPVTVSNGVAQTVVSNLAVGDHSFSAEFTPAQSGEYQASSSAVGSIKITPVVPTIVINGGKSGPVKPGDTIAFEVGPFGPGESVSGEVRSDPIQLGTFTADASGMVRLNWKVPANFPAGAHTASFTPAGGSPVTLSFTVSAAASGAQGAGGGSAVVGKTAASNTAATKLATTGSEDAIAPALTGVLALMLGAGVMLLARRRQAVR